MSAVDATRAALAVTPGFAQAGLDDGTVAAILEEAEKFADGTLAPLDRIADAQGCRLAEGRVRTPAGYAEAWRRMGADGWLAMDLAEALGGQGLPTLMHAAVSPLFEGAAMGFMMANGASRAAAHMLAAVAPGIAAEWAPRLALGEWAATIAISEADAGSDVGRIRTRAVRDGDRWRITGEKTWISFGDHDMAARIGHCLLARTGPTEAGTRGLSLFLVPDRAADGARGGVTVSRIEQKTGLHGSPTCTLAFDDAEGVLLGELGRGVPALFAMIERMRLQTACQGLGIAQRAVAIARGYAAERRQGGAPDAPPPAIATHPDVRRQLAVMEAATEVLRAVTLEVARLMDAAGAGDAPSGARAAILLPLTKTFGGETGFEVASGAVQVLGGAGYTRDWPVERHMRDARVITIYEGTTGMQAQDFLFRRLLRDDGAAMGRLLADARSEIAACPDPDAATIAQDILTRFEALAADLRRVDDPARLALAADGFMRAGWAAVTGWMCCRMIRAGDVLARRARCRLHTLRPEFERAAAGCRIDPNLV